jgi:hypothetical protein
MQNPTNASTPDLEAIKSRQQKTWASADFGRIGVRLQIVGGDPIATGVGNRHAHPARRLPGSGDPARTNHAAGTGAGAPSRPTRQQARQWWW